MGANNSNIKYHQNIYNTPPKDNHRFLFDPRSPTGEISRTPIQIDCQLPIPPLKLYNHVMTNIIRSDINISEENNHQKEKLDVEENESKHSSGVEPILDSTKVLTALVVNNNGESPP